MNRYEKTKKASIFGILGNFLLFAIKIVASSISGSEAMLADAFNSGSDILSSLITYIGNKIASKPRDDDHNLGHGKAEYIYSMLLSIIMIITSLSLLKSSFLALINNHKYTFSIYLVIVCIITIIIKVFLYLYTKNIAKKENNILLRANSKDHRNDLIITTLNLLSVILSIFDIYFVDGVVGIIISAWILVSGIKIFIESYDVLMDKSISQETKNEVLEIVKSHKEIKKVNHFNSTPVGFQYQISLTIFVDGNLSTFESHEIADNLEKEINKKIPEIYLTVIHVNPIIIKDNN